MSTHQNRFVKMKAFIVISLLCVVNVESSLGSIVEKFKEFEVIPDILNVAPSKLLEVGLHWQLLYLNLQSVLGKALGKVNEYNLPVL